MMVKFNELLRLLKAATSAEQVDELRDIIVSYIPKISVMFGFDQQNHAHQYDLWNHCVHTMLNLPKDIDDPMLYLAALLHDIGKPDCQCRGKREDDTNMHYYSHPRRSMEIVRDRVIPELISKGALLSEDEQRRLLYYVEYHDDRVSLREKHMKHHLQMVSLNEFKNLMHLQVADAKAHIMLPVIEERIRVCSILSGEYADEKYQELKSGGLL